MEVDAEVEEGGVLHVLYPAGTPVRITVSSGPTDDGERAEREAFVERFLGCVQDPTSEVPPSSPSRSIEPIAVNVTANADLPS